MQPKYDDAYPFSEGLAGVYDGSNWGYVDNSGKDVIPLKYDNAKPFSKGLARVLLNGKEGYVGRDGTEYFEP